MFYGSWEFRSVFRMSHNEAEKYLKMPRTEVKCKRCEDEGFPKSWKLIRFEA